MKKVLGLDIGIASIGWAFTEIDDQKLQQVDPETGELTLQGKIIGLGVRTFTQAENQKDGKSLALPRREKRSQRRRLRRRRQRLNQIKDLFQKHNILSAQDIENILQSSCPVTSSPWHLRAAALERQLTPQELFRSLYHLAKLRGYKPQKSDSDDKNVQEEQGKVKEAIQQNRQSLKEAGLLSFPQLMIANQAGNDPIFRNRDGSYLKSVSRQDIKAEADLIFTHQKKFGFQQLSDDFYSQFHEIAFYQRAAMDKQQLEKMIGRCIFEKDERRAPKQCYSSELFVLLTKISNLTLRTIDNPEKIELTSDQKNKIYELAHQQKSITYKTIRKTLGLSENIIYRGLAYSNQADKNGKIKDAESAKFIELQGYHAIKKVYEEFGETAFQAIFHQQEKFDKIGEVLTNTKSEEETFGELVKIVQSNVAEKLKYLNFKKHLHLSLKALKKINPHLRQWHGYAEACELAGYKHHDPDSETQKFDFLPSFDELEKLGIYFDEIRNPVVHRAICQVRKVINAVIRQHGRPDQINIEFTRDSKNSLAERNKIKKEQEKYRQEKEKAAENCQEIGLNPDSGDNLLKFRLWRQQNEKCVYSGKDIRIEHLQDPLALEIDHIIPYSRSLDDSLHNKVLCFIQENRQKRNQIPSEYFGLDSPKWLDFKQWVMAMNLPKPKQNRLLKIKHEDENSFIERNLRDTSYITRYAASYIRSFLKLNDHKNVKNAVQTRNGSLTAFLRHRWGFSKERQAGDLHHALDALMCAVSTQGMVQYLSRYTSRLEEMGKEWLKRFAVQSRIPVPWGNLESFREEVMQHMSRVFVSRAPRRKASGSVHDETIRSVKKLSSDGVSALRTKLLNIKAKNTQELDELIFDTDRGANSVYQVLKEQLEQYGWDSKKAFASNVHMRRRDGTQGPVIKTVRIKETQKSGMPVRQGIANNGDMVRVDVFSKDKKFYLVPIYLKDAAKDILPNQAATAGKDEKDWRIMDGTYQFQFSIFKDELILVKKKKEAEIFGYYMGMHRGTAAVNFEHHDSSKVIDGIGVQNLEKFKKYQVDILGNYREVTGEKRQPFGKARVV